MVEMTGKKGIGIIGYGGFGEFVHRAWNEMDNAHVTAICDSDPSRNPGGDATFYTSIEDMLADKSVDIVSVATPPFSHKAFSIQSMRAGKHVLIEKPLALTEEDALEIKRVAEETGRVATVNHILRYNSIVEKLREIVQSEVLGKLRRLDLRNYAMQETVPEGHWFWVPELSGRILLEHGVHFFDLASWVIDSKGKEMWSLGVDRKPGMEDEVFAVVKYENDVVGTFWHSFSRPRQLETTTFHFAFDLGEIEMVGWIPLGLEVWGWTNQEGLDRLKEWDQELKVVEDRMQPIKAHSSDQYYDVQFEVTAELEIEAPKLEVYSESIRAVMDDLIKAIDDPSHKMRITIDDAIEAVRVAEQATNAAHPEKEMMK